MRFLLGLLVVILLGSCASQNGPFIKKRYSNGYYFSHNANKHTKPLKEPVATRVKNSVNQKSAVVMASSAVVARSLFVPDKHLSFVPHRKSSALEALRKPFTPKSDMVFSKSSIVKKSSVIKPVNTFHGASVLEAGPIPALICFIIFTALYLLCILSKAPEMNFFVALGLAMLCSLFTTITGEVITC